MAGATIKTIYEDIAFYFKLMKIIITPAFYKFLTFLQKSLTNCNFLLFLCKFMLFLKIFVVFFLESGIQKSTIGVPARELFASLTFNESENI